MIWYPFKLEFNPISALTVESEERSGKTTSFFELFLDILADAFLCFHRLPWQPVEKALENNNPDICDLNGSTVDGMNNGVRSGLIKCIISDPATSHICLIYWLTDREYG